MANLKIGDKVIMNDKYWVSAENKGKVWTRRTANENYNNYFAR